MNKGSLRLLGLCIAASMVLSPMTPVLADQDKNQAVTQDKDSAEVKKNEIEKELDQVSGEIGSMKNAKSELEGNVEKLDSELNDLAQKLDDLNTDLTEKQDQIKKTKKLLKKAKKKEKNQYGAMKKRIRYLFENGDFAYAEMIFSSENITQLLNNTEYVSKISEYDREMLTKYQETKQLIVDKQTELKAAYAASETMQAEVSQQEAEVKNVVSSKKEEIDNYNAQISNSEEQAAFYASEMEAQNSILAEIQAQEAAIAAAEEAARQEVEAAAAAAEEAAAAAQDEANKKAEVAAQAAAEAEASQDETAQAEAQQKQSEAAVAQEEADQQQQQAEDTANTNTSNAGAGGFVWPCPSSYNVTSEFGNRESPTAGASSNHMGIDIGAPSGTSIVAAASGTVVIAQYSSSAGNYVSISHGNGLYTVYMHASALYVSPGQLVSAGESIAAVGSTGYSTGPHLHFGVTLNGAYVNPRNYVG